MQSKRAWLGVLGILFTTTALAATAAPQNVKGSCAGESKIASVPSTCVEWYDLTAAEVAERKASCTSNSVYDVSWAYSRCPSYRRKVGCLAEYARQVTWYENEQAASCTSDRMVFPDN